MKISIFAGLVILCTIAFLGSFCFSYAITKEPSSPLLRWWDIQSIDTMKYSRDIAREKMHDTSFDEVITTQVKAIKDLGATHMAVGTPYDEEFKPFLSRWVREARKVGLKVWYRGNFAGWEQWFDYPKISREEHLKKLEAFILSNPDLFEDGDILTSCHECENGGPGDPRMTGDVDGFRSFMIREHEVGLKAMKKIGKDVVVGYFGSNGDVARLIYDVDTTKRVGGQVTIDHYVKDPKKFLNDLKDYAKQSQGEVVIGEIGVPIPDIHGELTEAERQAWMKEVFSGLIKEPSLKGINYWVLTGGSTKLLNDDHSYTETAKLLKTFFAPTIFSGTVVDELERPIAQARISTQYRVVQTDNNGKFSLPIYGDESVATVSGDLFHPQEIPLTTNPIITVSYKQNPPLFVVKKFLYMLFPFLRVSLPLIRT